MSDYVSDYIDQGIFGEGNCEWAKNPEKDPMYEAVEELGLQWKYPDQNGFYRVHYLHCSGIWVDRVHLEKTTCDGRPRMKVVETGSWADHTQAEWMLIPEDFSMPMKQELDHA